MYTPGGPTCIHGTKTDAQVPHAMLHSTHAIPEPSAEVVRINQLHSNGSKYNTTGKTSTPVRSYKRCLHITAMHLSLSYNLRNTHKTPGIHVHISHYCYSLAGLLLGPSQAAASEQHQKASTCPVPVVADTTKHHVSCGGDNSPTQSPRWQQLLLTTTSIATCAAG